MGSEGCVSWSRVLQDLHNGMYSLLGSIKVVSDCNQGKDAFSGHPNHDDCLENDFKIGIYLLSPLPLFCTCTYVVRAVCSEETLRILGRRSVGATRMAKAKNT